MTDLVELKIENVHKKPITHPAVHVTLETVAAVARWASNELGHVSFGYSVDHFTVRKRSPRVTFRFYENDFQEPYIVEGRAGDFWLTLGDDGRWRSLHREDIDSYIFEDARTEIV